jgi:SAM-dependent methyltransferase
LKLSSLGKTWEDRKNREQLYCTAEYWDTKAAQQKSYAVSMWPNNHLNHYYHQERLSLLQKYLPSVEGAKVLDVGCGTGRISRYLAGRGATVLGIDFSAQAIAIAQEQSPVGNPRYRKQSIFDLTEESAFDILVSWGTLAIACKNGDELLKVMHRLCKSARPIHKGFLHRVLNMDVQEFCAAMSQAGFQIEDVSHLHCWPLRLLLAYVSWPKWITATGYYTGEWVMSLVRHKALGDYKAIFATVVG